MNKRIMALILAASAGLLALGIMASEREHESEREYGEGSVLRHAADPKNALYQQDCGSCHLAYPPALLPTASWRAVMGGLADHFGDNAELDPARTGDITVFLARNAAEKAGGDYAERTWRATQGRAPILRITETEYFRGQHHEIPAKMVTGNPQVGSFSRCEACHTRAAAGSFDEHGVRIPGYGRFED